jgi:hypothetical protein
MSAVPPLREIRLEEREERRGSDGEAPVDIGRSGMAGGVAIRGSRVSRRRQPALTDSRLSHGGFAHRPSLRHLGGPPSDRIYVVSPEAGRRKKQA